MSQQARVGFVCDSRMMGHHNLWDPLHIECPDRLRRPLDVLRESAILDQCVELEPRLATHDELLMVHREEYIE